MTRHYVLTRSAYGPAWSLAANRRRLEVTRAVTARLMELQTDRDWTWVVVLDREDPLLEEREAVFAAVSDFVPLLWTPPERPKSAPWDKHAASNGPRQKIAYEAYRAPWREAIGNPTGPLAMTRLDDDDGLAPDAMARYRSAAARVRRTSILMLPQGIRVFHGRYSPVTHNRNAMHTLVTMAGESKCVYDYGHATCHKAAPVVMVDHRPGWIWVRHQDTISGHKVAALPLTGAIRRLFPIDWSVIR